MNEFTSYQKTMETVLNNISTYIYVMDPNTGKILFANQAAAQRFPGKEADALQGSELHAAILSHMRNAPEANVGIAFQAPQYFELHFSQPTEQWLGVQRTSIRWINSAWVWFFTCMDITDRKLHNQYVEFVTYKDSLTGLPNRQRFEQDVQHALSKHSRTKEEGYVLYMNMDDFKIVNEGYGHEYGDGLLVQFSMFLVSLVGRYYVYRFNGGDEFAVLITDTQVMHIGDMLEALMRRVRQPWNVLGHIFYCTLSVGICAFSQSGGDARNLIRNAEIALHATKRSGKNNYMFFNQQMCNVYNKRANMEKMMRDAIASGMNGFTVYFQPYVQADTGALVGAEALIRWFHSDGKLILPCEFISLSEYLGLIVQLGDFVMHEAAKILKYINDNLNPAFKISVNMSIRQLQQSDIILRVESMLAETGINPNNLTFEITEGLAATEMQRIQLICEEFRKKGIQVAMDDFGTGYSSLGNIRTLPLDIIKIDQCFIQDIDSDAYSNSLIRLITDLGHSMGKTICIEGVETAEQAAYCRDAKADIIQGFYYHKPMSQQQLFTLLRSMATASIC